MATSIATMRSAEEPRRQYSTTSLGEGRFAVLSPRRPTRRTAIGVKTTERRMERRISERGASFLPQARSRDISSAKFRTALTVRSPRHAGGRPAVAGAADFRALASARLVLPPYIVTPAAAEAADSAVAHGSRNDEAAPPTSDRVAGRVGPERSKSRIKEWYDLVMRPVSRRPDYAQPIVCKTPADVPRHFDYLRPRAGLFYSVDRALPRKTYDLSPEFLSESKRSIDVREMASNTLKFGWG